VTKNKELYRQLASYKDYTSICNSAPSEYLAIVALSHKDIIWKRNLDIIKDNLEILTAFFKKYRHIFLWVPPKSGPIAFPKLLLDVDVERFCIDLAQKKNVLLLPSTCFSFGNRHFRIGFGRKNMREAIIRLDEYIQEGYLEKLQQK